MGRKKIENRNSVTRSESISITPAQKRAAVELYGSLTKAAKSLMVPVLNAHIKKCNNVEKIN